MRKGFLTAFIVSAITASLTLSSCIGSFSLTSRLLDWNKSIDNKFVNEVVFFAFWILPVYEVSGLADALVLNSIEFWTGKSPLASTSKIIEGNDGKYLVESDSNGYTITSLNDKSVVRLDFDQNEQTWSLVGTSGEEYKLMTFVDDSHMKVNIGNGEMMLIERSQEGLMALQEAVKDRVNFLAQK